MSLVAFDTYSFVKRLTASGMPEAQAEVLAEFQSALLDEKLATKGDLAQLATKIDLAELKGRIIKLEWMLGFLIAGVLALIAKAFAFHS